MWFGTSLRLLHPHKNQVPERRPNTGGTQGPHLFHRCLDPRPAVDTRARGSSSPTALLLQLPNKLSVSSAALSPVIPFPSLSLLPRRRRPHDSSPATRVSHPSLITNKQAFLHLYSRPFFAVDQLVRRLRTCPRDITRSPRPPWTVFLDDCAASPLVLSRNHSLARSLSALDSLPSRPAIQYTPSDLYVFGLFPTDPEHARSLRVRRARSLPPTNTAKLSSPILLPRTVSYDVGTNPPPRSGRVYPDMADRSTGCRRRRSSSILQVYHEPPETLEQISDQAALPNLNANWNNAKGAWTIHIVLIAALKIFYDVIPGVSQETSWTLTNITYMFGSYLMFHYVRGVPFEFNSGAFDNLNMWEQIDNGAQYTPTKKFLLSVPIVLFLLSTHYTHYDLAYFIINFLAVLGVIIPKLPFSHRMRVGLFSGIPEE